MQFIYRGVAYEAKIAGTEAPETEQTGTFLGSTYKIKQSSLAQNRSQNQLIYRGVHYSR